MGIQGERGSKKNPPTLPNSTCYGQEQNYTLSVLSYRTMKGKESSWVINNKWTIKFDEESKRVISLFYSSFLQWIFKAELQIYYSMYSINAARLAERNLGGGKEFRNRYTCLWSAV